MTCAHVGVPPPLPVHALRHFFACANPAFLYQRTAFPVNFELRTFSLLCRLFSMLFVYPDYLVFLLHFLSALSFLFPRAD
jgi:hypothetical protein